MKIGIWLDKPVDKLSGGSYTYYNTLISGIDSFNFNQNIEIVYISDFDAVNLNRPVINIKPYRSGISYFAKTIRKALKLISADIFDHTINAIDQKEKRIKDSAIAMRLKERGVKMIFYPLPATPVINGIPYILNNWDLAHYSTYAFPEIAGEDGFNSRNNWYVNVMPSALMIFCETEAGKVELIRHLNIDPCKIRVLPIFASSSFLNAKVPDNKQSEILNHYELQREQFFFYPAQFWPHKNHYNLVKAFQKFVAQYPGFKLVLCGSDKGNMGYITELVKSLSLKDHVIFSGFIDDNYLYTLYMNARALTMPTFLGPSNIPPIEAMHLGCPVLCSALEGHRELLGDGAVYFDPSDELSILESMKIIANDSKRSEMREKQKAESKSTDHTIEKALIKLDKHLTEVINIRSCWE